MNSVVTGIALETEQEKNLFNLLDLDSKVDSHISDLRNQKQTLQLVRNADPEIVFHLAAQPLVREGYRTPVETFSTNILGTVHLLDAIRHAPSVKAVVVITTDKVYQNQDWVHPYRESDRLGGHDPYSASKASSDHFVRAYHETFKLPVVISNCSNNYGSHQFPEKLIPLMIHNILNEKPLPIYGKGDNIRDWLWVEDHASAIDAIFHRGRIGESYNVGGLNEWTNIELVRYLCQIMDKKLGRSEGSSEKLLTYVTDRAGHDKRYAIDASKLEAELGWKPSITFEQGLERTVDWYLENQEWVSKVTSGAYQTYYEQMYSKR
jgi:dTDP-glucose 4,6-dehydratase